MLSYISSTINNNFVTLLGFIPVDYRIDTSLSITDSIMCRNIKQFLDLLPLVDLDASPNISFLDSIGNKLRYKLLTLCQSISYIEPIIYLLPEIYNFAYVRTDIDTPTLDEVVKCMIKKYGKEILLAPPTRPTRGNMQSYITQRVNVILNDVADITKLTLDELIIYCDCEVNKILSKDNIEYLSKVFYENYKIHDIVNDSYLSTLHMLLNNEVDIPLDIIEEIMRACPYSPGVCYQQINMYIEAYSGRCIEVSTLLSYINTDCNYIIYRIVSIILPYAGVTACSVMIMDLKVPDRKLLQLIIDSLDSYSQTLVMGTLRAQTLADKRSRCTANLFTIQKIALLTKIDKDIRQKIIDELLHNIFGITIQIE